MEHYYINSNIWQRRVGERVGKPWEMPSVKNMLKINPHIKTLQTYRTLMNFGPQSKWTFFIPINMNWKSNFQQGGLLLNKPIGRGNSLNCHTLTDTARNFRCCSTNLRKQHTAKQRKICRCWMQKSNLFIALQKCYFERNMVGGLVLLFYCLYRLLSKRLKSLNMNEMKIILPSVKKDFSTFIFRRDKQIHNQLSSWTTHLLFQPPNHLCIFVFFALYFWI